jgi:type II secretory pathway pseudopilin PulG
MRKRRNSVDGMTLLELMFAAAVMAITLSMLFGSLLNITFAGGTSEAKTFAASRLSSTMEQLRGLTFAELLSYQASSLGRPGTVLVQCFDAANTATTIPLPSGKDSTTINLPDPLTVRVTVTCSDERGHSVSSSASQLFYR